MKRNLFQLMTLLMVAMLSLIFNSCSKDKDDNNGSLIGSTWSGIESKEELRLTFQNEGVGTYKFIRYKKKTTPLEVEKEKTGSFSYVSKDETTGSITTPYLTVYDDIDPQKTVTFDYVISDNTMNLYDSKHPDDLEWVLTKQ